MTTNDEIRAFSDKIIEQVDRLIACLDGLQADDLNWRPPAPDANSLYVLATHVMGNVQETVLSLLGGQSNVRDRDSEFIAAGASADDLQQRWNLLKEHVQETLAKLDPAELDREREHPRRHIMQTGREMLLSTACHAAEHAGQAELTQDLLRGRT